MVGCGPQRLGKARHGACGAVRRGASLARPAEARCELARLGTARAAALGDVGLGEAGRGR